MDKPENPIAFPVVDYGAYQCPGMSLRDWFAGQALNQAVQDYDRLGRKHSPQQGNPLLPYAAEALGTREEIIARQAYRYADAMLTTRAKGGDDAR